VVPDPRLVRVLFKEKRVNSVMIVAGKCPPEKEELRYAAERGFEHVELYLEKKHLDQIEETVENVKKSDVEAVSVHTPHVSLDNRGYLKLADYLASELNAYLVFHSQFLHHTHIPELEKLNIKSSYGYENNPGVSKTFLEKGIVEQGHELVLDTAHFFLGDHSSEDFRSFLETNIECIELIHLCDSSWTKDGLPFGEGDMDMERFCQDIDNSGFDGILVFEVMPDHQEDAFEKWKNYTR